MKRDSVQEFRELRAASLKLADQISECCPLDQWLDTTPCPTCRTMAEESCEIMGWAIAAQTRAKRSGQMCHRMDCDCTCNLNQHGLCPECAVVCCGACGEDLTPSEREGECPYCKYGTWTGHTNEPPEGLA